MHTVEWKRKNFSGEDERSEHDGAWTDSNQVDDFTELVEDLFNEVKAYGFPDGSLAGYDIADCMKALESWILKTGD